MLKPAEVDYLFEKFGEVLTPTEVATTIRASDSFIHSIINDGKLPCYRVGVHFRVLKPDVVSYLKASAGQPPEGAGGSGN